MQELSRMAPPPISSTAPPLAPSLPGKEPLARIRRFPSPPCRSVTGAPLHAAAGVDRSRHGLLLELLPERAGRAPAPSWASATPPLHPRRRPVQALSTQRHGKTAGGAADLDQGAPWAHDRRLEPLVSSTTKHRRLEPCLFAFPVAVEERRVHPPSILHGAASRLFHPRPW